jgi:REP element-mobilizing transposase RayT
VWGGRLARLAVGAPVNSVEKASRYYYRRHLPPYQKADVTQFVTFRTYAHLILPEPARDLVLQHCFHDHGKRLLLTAAVVMPNHVHLLVKALRDPAGWPYELPVLLHSLKSASAHSVNKLLSRNGQVWQNESFDHVLRSYESLKAKCEYVRQNPVRAGLVDCPNEYPWTWIESGVLAE